MKQRLKQVVENGKLVWRISDQAEKIEAPCDALRRAKAKAEKVTAEIKAEREKKDLTASPSG